MGRACAGLDVGVKVALLMQNAAEAEIVQEADHTTTAVVRVICLRKPGRTVEGEGR